MSKRSLKNNINYYILIIAVLILNRYELFAVPTPEILWHFDTDDSAFGMTAMEN